MNDIPFVSSVYIIPLLCFFSNLQFNVTEKELRDAFVQICGDMLGYPAGGVGLGWNMCSLTLTGNSSRYVIGCNNDNEVQLFTPPVFYSISLNIYMFIFVVAV